eukprot:3329880-Rhodomonas_salina.1
MGMATVDQQPASGRSKRTPPRNQTQETAILGVGALQCFAVGLTCVCGAPRLLTQMDSLLPMGSLEVPALLFALCLSYVPVLTTSRIFSFSLSLAPHHPIPHPCLLYTSPSPRDRG